MADNKNMVKFGRGTKSLEEFKSVTGYQNMVYFNTDEYEIYVGDNKYGFSKADQALLGDGGIHDISFDAATSKLIIELNSKNEDNTHKTVSVDLPAATATAAGLMTSTHVNALAAAALEIETLTGEGVGSVKKAQSDAEAYAKGLVDSVLSEDVDADGAAIVKISQVEDENGDKKIVAEAGDVEAAHISVADAGEKFTATNVEGVLAEIASKISDLNDSADGVAGQITTALDALDFSDASIGGEFVTVNVVQENGKIKSVTVSEDNIAKADDLDALEALVGSADDAAAADGSVYARIAALVAKDGDLSGRLDALEGEDGAVAEALADAKKYADGLVAGLDANVSSAGGQKLTVNVVEVDGVITEVNVTDHDIASAASLKSLTDKVDAFLDAEGLADETLDTLKEIQNFINSEAGAADQMVKDIAANKEAIEKEVTDRENAIKGLNSEKTGEGTFVDVTVKQEAGVITSITVNESKIANSDDLDALEALVGTATDGKDANTVFGKIAAEADARTALANKVGEPIADTIAQDIANINSAIEDLETNKVDVNTSAIALLNNTVETVGSVKHTAKGYADAAEEAALNAAKTYTDEALYWYEG